MSQVQRDKEQQECATGFLMWLCSLETVYTKGGEHVAAQMLLKDNSHHPSLGWQFNDIWKGTCPPTPTPALWSPGSDIGFYSALMHSVVCEWLLTFLVV